MGDGGGMKELFTLVTVAEARDILARHWSPAPLDQEEVPLTSALGRVTAREIKAPEDVPGFDRSTVDGFALRAADTFGASEGMPGYVTVVGEVAMGGAPGGKLGPGECMQIATGGMLPAGSDAVVMVEHTEALDSTTLSILRPVAPGENVIRRDEDLKAGGVILPAGRRLRPGDIGLLAACGLTRVPVVRRPRVAIISTGNELVDPAAKPAPGQVRDVNTYTLGAMVEEAGGEVSHRWVVEDCFEQLYPRLEEGLAAADVTVISGGSSVGTRDLTAQLIEEAGRPGVLVHGVAVRPGKPTIIGLARGKPIFGLPGHPVSALITFDLFVRPCLERLQGRPEKKFYPTVRARLNRNVASAAGREDYVRVILHQEGEEITAEPVLGKSGLISTMARAHGLVRIPLHQEGFLAGEEVEVRLL